MNVSCTVVIVKEFCPQTEKYLYIDHKILQSYYCDSPLWNPKTTLTNWSKDRGPLEDVPCSLGLGHASCKIGRVSVNWNFFQARYSCKCSIGLGLWSWRQGQGLCVRFSEQFLRSFCGLVRHIVSLYHQGAKKGVLNQQRC